MCVHKAIMGVAPAFGDVHIGADGQLWRWDHGQVLLARSGKEAIEYARAHGWPERLVSLLHAMSAIIR